jgi:hypothetical protein
VSWVKIRIFNRMPIQLIGAVGKIPVFYSFTQTEKFGVGKMMIVA